MEEAGHPLLGDKKPLNETAEALRSSNSLTKPRPDSGTPVGGLNPSAGVPKFKP